MKVKEESEKAGLKLNIQKTMIMASGPITPWQIDGEAMETVRDFIFLGSKITVDGDWNHEINRCLLLGRKTMTNLDSILKTRDIALLTKICIVKAMTFQFSSVLDSFKCGAPILVQFSHSVVSDSLWPHGLQHARLLCSSPTLRTYSNSCPSSRWYHPTISSSVIPSPPTFNLSQHQGLFTWASSSHQVAKVLEFQLQH